VWFLLDIYITFHVCVEDRMTRELVHDRAAIARRYLRGWLVVDLVSAMPLTVGGYTSG
jgi:hypothetical protein